MRTRSVLCSLCFLLFQFRGNPKLLFLGFGGLGLAFAGFGVFGASFFRSLREELLGFAPLVLFAGVGEKSGSDEQKGGNLFLHECLSEVSGILAGDARSATRNKP
jgi:hypothetical protein